MMESRQRVCADIDKGALQLIAEHRQALFGKARKLGLGEDEADELVIRTIDRAIRKIDTYAGRGNIRTWMSEILENIFRNDHRSPVARGTSAVDADTLESCVGADNRTIEEIERNSDCDIVREAIRQLDPEYRKVVALYYYNELTLREIAAFMNSSTSSVSRKLEVGRRILAAKLEGRLGGARRSLAAVAAALLAGGAAWGLWTAVGRRGGEERTAGRTVVTAVPFECGLPSTGFGAVEGLIAGEARAFSFEPYTNQTEGVACRALGWEVWRTDPATGLDLTRLASGDGDSCAYMPSEAPSETRFVWLLEVSYLVTASAGPGGTVKPSSQWVRRGMPAAVEARADVGWRFADWQTTAGNADRDATFMESVECPLVLSARFEQANSQFVGSTSDPQGCPMMNVLLRGQTRYSDRQGFGRRLATLRAWGGVCQ